MKKSCMTCGGRPKYQRGKYATDLPDLRQIHASNPMDAQLTSEHGISYEQVPEKQGFNPFNLGLGFNAASDILSEISGKMERNRQRNYLQSQYSTLNQANPMPYQDSQPNPYSLYARYGGKLKTYQRGGQVMKIVQMYAQISQQDPQAILKQLHQMPANQQKQALQQMAQAVQQAQQQQQGQQEQQPQQQMQTQGAEDEQAMAALGGMMNHIIHNKSFSNHASMNMGDDASNMYKQFGGALTAIKAMFQNGGISPEMMQAQLMKGGGNWIQKAVNPAHKGYCTPMSKSTCTGHRRQFALMMKKKHGFQK